MDCTISIYLPIIRLFQLRILMKKNNRGQDTKIKGNLDTKLSLKTIINHCNSKITIVIIKVLPPSILILMVKCQLVYT